MEGITYTSYDSDAKLYRGYGFEDTSPQVREESGTVDGNKLVMTTKPWAVMGQPAVPYRTTFALKGEDIHMLLEVKTGDDWTKLGEATFKKKPAMMRTAAGGS